MSETKFPKAQDYFMGEIHWDSSWYEDDAIHDWFRRCIEDYKHHLGCDKHTWFLKWFSQFTNNCEENK